MPFYRFYIKGSALKELISIVPADYNIPSKVPLKVLCGVCQKRVVGDAFLMIISESYEDKDVTV